jgi:undecaprenyl-diphosphatase
MLFGVFFILYEQHLKKQPQKIKNDLTNLTMAQSLLIGVVQVLAVIPGVSRSGIVILFMLLIGQKRTSAAKYSFLLAIPTILGSAAFDLIKTQASMSFLPTEITVVVIGFLVSFVVAIIFLRWLISYLQKNSLAAFGYYRLGLGLILLAFLW